MKPRTAKIRRRTSETDVEVRLSLDGTGESRISTGIGFLDHMLASLSKHARFDLAVSCKGDLQVDDHHTSEDVALGLGEAIDKALADRKGIARIGSAHAPLDEALARVVVDFSGRPFPAVDLGLKRGAIGNWACENIAHFFQSLAVAGRCALHVDVLKGANDHHRVEAAFKAAALALRQAVALDGGRGVPSTKGTL